jgi:hypothetical protein
MSAETIHFQEELIYQLPKISNHKDYSDYCELIERMDEIIKITGLDLAFAHEQLHKINAELVQQRKDTLSVQQSKNIVAHSVKAYRCTICKILLGKSYRELSIQLADSTILQRFCTIARINDQMKIPTKSTLQRYAEMFDEAFLRSQVDRLNRKAVEQENPLQLQDPFTTEDVYVDATCLKANIHFPVDWVLMKDCMMTILKAIIVIRKHGLKHRIKTPEKFMSEINAICMSMTSIGRKPGSRKERKTMFRKLKSISQVIRQHGVNYARRLREDRESKTDLSEAQAACVLKRLDKMIELLPKAIKQANSRIISNKMTKNEDKILSAYHDNVNVIKRGKTGGQFEYGNPLFIAEQKDGVILDWKLYETDVKEPQSTKESIKRLTEDLNYEIKSLTGDRGCQSEANDKLLQKKGIVSGLCPRDPDLFIEKMEDVSFRKHQKRRAQTEGRIGIFKNSILDGSLYERSVENKQMKVAWAVLTHNLWCIARLPSLAETKKEAA